MELTGLLEVLRDTLKERRAAFLNEKLSGVNHFNAQDREQIDGLMDELIERLLVRPAERLRAEREHRKKIQSVEAIRDLFLSDREKP